MVILAKVPKASEAESKLVNEKAEDAIKHYKEFVNQTDMYAYTATKAYPRGDRMAKYGFGDSNGDSVPELHISGGEKYDIYTYKKGKVVLLCELGWRYAMITAAKDGAMAACGRLDTEADAIEGSANYRIPPEDDIFADVGRIDGSTDYYYYFKIDKKGEIIDKESIYFCKIFHEKKGSKKYTYYAGGKKCNKADWEKKVKLCHGILKDETKQLKWNDIFPKEEWDYLDAMEEGNGTLEKESDSEEWNFYKRILYYCSRMISSQYGTEFTNAHYEKIKKVYSIWICMNPPKKRENSITRYNITEENLIGEVKEKREHYDLMTTIMICLGKAEKEEHASILKLLDVLLSTDTSSKEKCRILEEDFQIEMTQTLESEVSLMCNLSKGVEEKAIKIGEAKGIKIGEAKGKAELIRTMLSNGLTIEQIVTMCNITKEEIETLLNRTNAASGESL